MTDHATSQEIIDAYAALIDAEKRVIYAVARKHIGGPRFSEPFDLIHEALFLAVEGRRHWPRGLDFAVFLAMTIRSVAYADRTSSENAKAANFPVEDILDWSPAGGAVAHPSAEDCAQRAQDNRIMWRRVASARARLSLRDGVAASVLDGLATDQPVAQLRRELSLCAAEFDAARKRVLRALRNTGRL